MTAGVLIEPGAIDEECVGGPAVGDQTFKDVAEDFFHRQIDAPVRREDQAVLVFQSEDPLLYRTGGWHGELQHNTRP